MCCFLFYLDVCVCVVLCWVFLSFFFMGLGVELPSLDLTYLFHIIKYVCEVGVYV